MLTYHLVFDNCRIIKIHEYDQISDAIGNVPNASTHFVGLYITGTPRGAMNSNPLDKRRIPILQKALEEELRK
ncbi:MAG: hypothetical protein KKB31_03630 [Nanoarchaeota archaeon]|nr:hypothetical protein [Nanoarchaeota archaeon]